MYAVPGGLIGTGLMIDPSLSKNNRLVGNVLGLKDKLPEVVNEFEIDYLLLKKLVVAD